MWVFLIEAALEYFFQGRISNIGNAGSRCCLVRPLSAWLNWNACCLLFPDSMLVQLFPCVNHRFPELLGRMIFCLESVPLPLNLNSMAPSGKELFQNPKHLFPRLCGKKSVLNGHSRLRKTFWRNKKGIYLLLLFKLQLNFQWVFWMALEILLLS